MNETDIIIEEFRMYGFALGKEKAGQFLNFYNMLVETNEVMNLTAITDFKDVLIKHFIDSISIEKILKEYQLYDNFYKKSNYKIIDIGTGAGFPGIPLKIYYPDINITLLDSQNKKIGFINEVIDKLSLTDIKTIHGRAEDIGKIFGHRQKYDLVVSRAVANASTLCEYCIPLVKPGGYFIAYKSMDSDEEIEKSKNAIKKLGGRLAEIYKFNLSDMGRSFMIVKKEDLTPLAYPRKAGTPVKKPLK